MITLSPSLEKLYSRFDDCKRCKEQKNPLRHILGGGKFEKPKFLFLFINPTHHNISSHSNYQGSRRFPFLGVRHFYKVLSQGGFIEKAIIEDIYTRGWQVEHENTIEKSFVKNDVYITNLVKCTQPHADNPSKQIIAEDLDMLQEEIDIVSPQYIVTFGKLPFQTLTNKDVRLKDRLEEIREKKLSNYQMHSTLGKSYTVLPCYFPVGRGNPPKAIEIMNYIKNNY